MGVWFCLVGFLVLVCVWEVGSGGFVGCWRGFGLGGNFGFFLGVFNDEKIE